MTPEMIVVLAKAFAIGIGGAMPALAIGLIGFSAMQSIGRNPEASDRVLTPMLIGMGLAEAIAIYALVIALTL